MTESGMFTNYLVDASTEPIILDQDDKIVTMQRQFDLERKKYKAKIKESIEIEKDYEKLITMMKAQLQKVRDTKKNHQEMGDILKNEK